MQPLAGLPPTALGTIVVLVFGLGMAAGTVLENIIARWRSRQTPAPQPQPAAMLDYYGVCGGGIKQDYLTKPDRRAMGAVATKSPRRL